MRPGRRGNPFEVWTDLGKTVTFKKAGFLQVRLPVRVWLNLLPGGRGLNVDS